MYGGHRFCADRSGAPSRIGADEISTGMAYKERREGGSRAASRNERWRYDSKMFKIKNEKYVDNL